MKNKRVCSVFRDKEGWSMYNAYVPSLYFCSSHFSVNLPLTTPSLLKRQLEISVSEEVGQSLPQSSCLFKPKSLSVICIMSNYAEQSKTFCKMISNEALL